MNPLNTQELHIISDALVDSIMAYNREIQKNVLENEAAKKKVEQLTALLTKIDRAIVMEQL